jgi:hypothetical protein
MLRVVGVDPGIVNLAFSVFDDGRFVHAELVNLVSPPWASTCEKDGACDLRHSKETVDRMDHFFRYAEQWFGTADVVLIERQPPGGVTHIHTELFRKYRDTAELVCPRTVHKAFGIGAPLHLTYEERKTYATARAYKVPGALACLRKYQKQDDVADAICLGVFYFQRKQEMYSQSVPGGGKDRGLDSNPFAAFQYSEEDPKDKKRKRADSADCASLQEYKKKWAAKVQSLSSGALRDLVAAHVGMWRVNMTTRKSGSTQGVIDTYWSLVGCAR